MSRPHLRPHFFLRVPACIEVTKSKLERQFAAGGGQFAGHVVGNHVQLVIRRKQRNIWTPWLTFTLTEEEGQTILRGKFAPHPSGWTLYLAAYGMVLITMLGMGFFGLSQWIAGLPATMLWGLPIGSVLLLALYGSAFVGQRWSAHQMEDMRAFVRRAFGPSEPAP